MKTNPQSYTEKEIYAVIRENHAHPDDAATEAWIMCNGFNPSGKNLTIGEQRRAFIHSIS